jgi:WD40 repeat protein
MSIGIYDFPACAFSADGSFLFFTSNKDIIVFEVRTGHKVFTILGSSDKPIRSMAKRGDLIATVSFDKSLYVLK